VDLRVRAASSAPGFGFASPQGRWRGSRAGVDVLTSVLLLEVRPHLLVGAGVEDLASRVVHEFDDDVDIVRRGAGDLLVERAGDVEAEHEEALERGVARGVDGDPE